jgi:hypothetical protein
VPLIVDKPDGEDGQGKKGCGEGQESEDHALWRRLAKNQTLCERAELLRSGKLELVQRTHMDKAGAVDAVTTIAVFKGRQIRRVLHENEWWFSVVDVVGALTDSPDAGAYWRKLKQRLSEEGSEVVTFCHGLKLEASDGKLRETDCADTEKILRIVQSIPSPKAEPFKRWLAKVGFDVSGRNYMREVEDDTRLES